jgi:hypothetical protein
MERYGIISAELSEVFAGYKVYFYSEESERAYCGLYRGRERAEEAVADWEELGLLPDCAEVME